jgi:hypothetical protein
VVYCANLGILPPIPLRGSLRERAIRAAGRRALSLSDLVRRAGIRLRATGGPQPRIVLWNAPHGRTVDSERRPLYAVNTSELPQRDPERAVRILEILAYGFFDYAARESVCERGIFVKDVTPDHGRAWLAEIGRIGGRARTNSKQIASRKNGARGPDSNNLDG